MCRKRLTEYGEWVCFTLFGTMGLRRKCGAYWKNCTLLSIIKLSLETLNQNGLTKIMVLSKDVSCPNHFSLLWWKTSLIFWYCFLTYKRVTICRRRRPNGRNQRENYMKWRIQRTHDKTMQHESELGKLLSESCNSWVPGRRPGWPPSQWDFMLYRLLSLSCMIQAVIYLIHCHVV